MPAEDVRRFLVLLQVPLEKDWLYIIIMPEFTVLYFAGGGISGAPHCSSLWQLISEVEAQRMRPLTVGKSQNLLYKSFQCQGKGLCCIM